MHEKQTLQVIDSFIITKTEILIHKVSLSKVLTYNCLSRQKNYQSSDQQIYGAYVYNFTNALLEAFPFSVSIDGWKNSFVFDNYLMSF